MQIPTFLNHFLSTLTGVCWWALALALGIRILIVATRTRAWQRALSKALPPALNYRQVFGAYAVGGAANTVIPARGGSLIKFFLTKHIAPGATYPLLISSVLVVAVIDIVLNWCFVLWGIGAGRLPALNELLTRPQVLGGLASNHPVAIALGGLAALVLATLILFFVIRRSGVLGKSISRGLSSLHDWRYLLRSVWGWELVGFALQLASWWFFLEAFGIGASIGRVCLIQAVYSLGAGLSYIPGGAIASQGMLIYALQGIAPTSVLLAFALGVRFLVASLNIGLGLTSLGFIWSKGILALRHDPELLLLRTQEKLIPEGALELSART